MDLDRRPLSLLDQRIATGIPQHVGGLDIASPSLASVVSGCKATCCFPRVRLLSPLRMVQAFRPPEPLVLVPQWTMVYFWISESILIIISTISQTRRRLSFYLSDISIFRSIFFFLFSPGQTGAIKASPQ